MMRSVLMLMVLACCAAGCADETRAEISSNSVAAYLQGAEFQAATARQEEEVRRGLNDMLTQSASQLKTMKYRDYQGRAGQWDITRLLKAHFVPARPMRLEAGRFFKDVEKPAARTAVRETLDMLDERKAQGVQSVF